MIVCGHLIAGLLQGGCVLHAVCHMPCATCRVPHAVACRMFRAVCRMLSAACRMLCAVCGMQYAVCHMPHATCRMPHAACFGLCVPHDVRCVLLHAACRAVRARAADRPIEGLGMGIPVDVSRCQSRHRRRQVHCTGIRGGHLEYRHARTRAIDMPSAMPSCLMCV